MDLSINKYNEIQNTFLYVKNSGKSRSTAKKIRRKCTKRVRNQWRIFERYPKWYLPGTLLSPCYNVQKQQIDFALTTKNVIKSWTDLK